MFFLNLKTKSRPLFSLILFVSLFLLFSGNCKASILYIEPEQGSYFQKDILTALIKIDTQEKCINAVSVNLKFDNNLLSVKDVSKASSIISFWMGEPEFSNDKGLVSFSGGIPGGYCGFVSGDPGEKELLVKIILEVKENFTEKTSGEINFLENSEVLLNDGLASKDNLSFRGTFFSLIPEPSREAKNDWEEELIKDKTPPLPFEIKIIQDPVTKEHFITFFATDKESGVDYYEVREGEEEWFKTFSPTYTLKDQKLKSEIKIKAIDKAGNQRIVEYNPSPAENDKKTDVSVPILILSFLILIIIIWILKRFFL